MNKDETIKDIANLMANRMAKSYGLRYRDFAEEIYNTGYRKVPDYAVILTPEERDEELKACNETQAKFEAEIEILKIQNNNLEIAFDRLNARTERFESNMKSVLEIEKRNAVKEFAEKLKRKAFDKDMFNDWAGATYVVLVKDIDETLKEYENEQ